MTIVKGLTLSKILTIFDQVLLYIMKVYQDILSKEEFLPFDCLNLNHLFHPQP